MVDNDNKKEEELENMEEVLDLTTGEQYLRPMSDDHIEHRQARHEEAVQILEQMEKDKQQEDALRARIFDEDATLTEDEYNNLLKLLARKALTRGSSNNEVTAPNVP